MSELITFEAVSQRLSLPLLFSGQSQKEVFINEAFSRIDGLFHCAIEGQASFPPPNPVDGTAWLISANASGEWSGREGHIALRQNGSWLLVAPCDGFRVVDTSTGQDMRFLADGWRAPATPAAAVGGSTIDVEARSMLASLVTALQQAGVFSA